MISRCFPPKSFHKKIRRSQFPTQGTNFPRLIVTDAQQLHNPGTLPAPLRMWIEYQRSMMAIHGKTISHRFRRAHGNVLCKKAKYSGKVRHCLDICSKRVHSGALRVNQFAKNRPIATAAFSSSILCCAADLASQVMLEDEGIIDWQRSIHRAIGSGFLYAGFYSNFYRWLGACDMYLPLAIRPLALPLKVITDTMIMTPFAYLPFFYWWMGLHAGRDNAESWEMYKQHFVRDASASLCVYVPGQVLNFSVIPGVWRVPFVNLQDFLWNVGFAYLQSGDQVQESPKIEEVAEATQIVAKTEIPRPIEQ